jgi:hypothetical protein
LTNAPLKILGGNLDHFHLCFAHDGWRPTGLAGLRARRRQSGCQREYEKRKTEAHVRASRSIVSEADALHAAAHRDERQQ